MELWTFLVLQLTKNNLQKKTVQKIRQHVSTHNIFKNFFFSRKKQTIELIYFI